MGHAMVDAEDVSITDLSEIDGVPVELNVRAVGDALGVENVDRGVVLAVGASPV